MTPVRKWYTAPELVALGLKGMPETVNGLNRMAKREGWRERQASDGSRLCRRRPGRGGGWEYHFNLLPMRAQRQLIATETAARIERDQACPKQQAKERLSLDARDDWYLTLPEDKKQEAKRRLLALETVRRNIDAGVNMTIARDEAAILMGCSTRTIQNWQARVEGLPPRAWLAALADDQGGGAPQAYCDPAAWEQLKSDYMRLEEPSFSSCYLRLVDKAERMGWRIPSQRALLARLKREVPEEVVLLTRKGQKAAKRLYRAQDRTRRMYHAMEAVNADGHQFDVWVKWPNPDGNGFTVVRPILIAIQDLYSGKIVGWSLSKSENAGAVREAIEMMLLNHGVPKEIYLDNGRAFAAKDITGGAPNRYRFKVRDDDLTGVLVQLGIKIHWAKPGNAQAKPVERRFRDFVDHVSKHPDNAGAYTGNAPHKKPENYGQRAVDLKDFERVFKEVLHRLEKQPPGRSEPCRRSKLSVAEMYAAGRKEAADEIAMPTKLQLHLLLRVAENITSSRQDGTLRLYGNSYWSEALIPHRGKKLVVRFNPKRLKDPVEVHEKNGAYIGQAACTEAVGFNDQAAAKQHAANQSRWLKKTKEAAALHREVISGSEPYMPQSDDSEPPLPDTNVVRMAQVGPPVARPAAQADTGGFSAEEVNRFMTRGLQKMIRD